MEGVLARRALLAEPATKPDHNNESRSQSIAAKQQANMPISAAFICHMWRRSALFRSLALLLHPCRVSVS